MYTSLGVMTKGTIIEVNTSDLGLVTQVSMPKLQMFQKMMAVSMLFF